MEILSNLEIVATFVLFIWSAVLVWGSWQIHVMARQLLKERRELRRWERLKGIWEEQQNGRRG